MREPTTTHTVIGTWDYNGPEVGSKRPTVLAAFLGDQEPYGHDAQSFFAHRVHATSVQEALSVAEADLIESVTHTKAHAVLERVKERIKDRTFDLTYIDYRDQLSPEQVQVLLTGENPYDADSWQHLEEAMSEQRASYSREAAEEVCEDDEWEVLQDAGLDLDLIDQIQDQDGSNYERDLIRNTHNLLFRYSLDEHITSSWADDAKTQSKNAQVVAESLGLEWTPEVQESCLELVRHATYGGDLTVLWYGDVETAIEIAKGPGTANDDTEPTQVGSITFGGTKGAWILLHDGWNGSGHDVQLPAVTLPWYTRKVHVDVVGPGYSWTTIAGPHEPAYASDITLTPAPTEA